MKLYQAINKKTGKICFVKCKCGIQNEIMNERRRALKNDAVTEFQKELMSGDELQYVFVGDFKKEKSADKMISELNGIVINIEEPTKKKKSKKEKVDYMEE